MMFCARESQQWDKTEGRSSKTARSDAREAERDVELRSAKRTVRDYSEHSAAAASQARGNWEVRASCLPRASQCVGRCSSIPMHGMSLTWPMPVTFTWRRKEEEEEKRGRKGVVGTIEQKEFTARACVCGEVARSRGRVFGGRRLRKRGEKWQRRLCGREGTTEVAWLRTALALYSQPLLRALSGGMTRCNYGGRWATPDSARGKWIWGTVHCKFGGGSLGSQNTSVSQPGLYSIYNALLCKKNAATSPIGLQGTLRNITTQLHKPASSSTTHGAPGGVRRFSANTTPNDVPNLSAGLFQFSPVSDCFSQTCQHRQNSVVN